VVAVDRSHGVLPADLPAAEVVAFEKRIDAVEVLRAAARALERKVADRELRRPIGGGLAG
jgi:hypothetical protein